MEGLSHYYIKQNIIILIYIININNSKSMIEFDRGA